MAWVTVLHAWTAAGLGDTDAGLRRLGLLIGLAMIAVLWWTGRHLGLGAPLVALVLFGMSPTTIVYGDEVRGYGLGALGVCWYMGAAWAFVEKPTWKTFLVAELGALLAVQAYFANCFLVLAICAGAAATCLRRRTWRTLAAVIALGAVAAVSSLVNLPTITRAFRVGTTTNLDLIARKLAESARPEDLIVVFPWYCGITFQRYYRGPTA